MKTKHDLVAGYNAQAAVTDDQIIIGADLRQEPVDATLLPDLLDATIAQATAAGLHPTTNTEHDTDHRNTDRDANAHNDNDTSDAHDSDTDSDSDSDSGNTGAGDVASDHDDSTGAGMDVLLADAGYASEKAYQHAEDQGIRLFAPRHKNIDPRTGDPSLDPIDPDAYPATARAQQRLATPQGQQHYKHRGRTVEPVFGQIKTIQHLTRFARRGHTAARSEWLFSCAVHNLRKYLNHPASSTPLQPA